MSLTAEALSHLHSSAVVGIRAGRRLFRRQLVAVFGALIGSGRFMSGLRMSLVIATAVAGVAAVITSRLRHQPDVSIAIEGVAP